jgi:hypothetical protein
MTITRFSQAPLDKVNELFDKLLATSSNAVKTREQLFVDLKEELEPLATFQDEHPFAALSITSCPLVQETRHECSACVGKASLIIMRAGRPGSQSGGQLGLSRKRRIHA